MLFSSKFVSSTREKTTLKKNVCAPYMRRDLALDKLPQSAEITVTGLGFYELFVNGKRLTRGLLSPYISNPDQLIVYDSYDLTEHLIKGENTIAFLLGNGMQNPLGGIIWDFDIASFRGVPRFAFALSLTENGETDIIEADETVLTKPSPLVFDDLRSGAFYDANKETDDLHSSVFAEGWSASISAKAPKGEPMLCEANPIKVRKELKPVKITKTTLAEDYAVPGWDIGEYKRLKGTKPQIPVGNEVGYLYDFGENTAGIVRLKIKGEKGQKVKLQFCEWINGEGLPSYSNIYFYPDGYSQRDIYICKGEGEEIFEPQFTYHGFRYCFVMGITEAQATDSLLTALVCSSDIKQKSAFSCSDEPANTLYETVLRSDLSNFYYFPTDCPHREKNGWTGDAVVSARQLLVNFGCEKDLIQWTDNIVKAQDEKGEIPGIVPTGTWGYGRLNGPAWDRAVVEIPYEIYRITGDKNALYSCAKALPRYLDFLETKKDKRGLIGYGLGDWNQAERACDKPDCPVIVSDSILCMEFARKSAVIAEIIGDNALKAKAEAFFAEMRKAIRKHLIKDNTVYSECQTAQAMGIYYGLFEKEELPEAKEKLVSYVQNADGHFSCGMLGLRIIFCLLADMGYADLAYNMIVREDFPSYGWLLRQGLTALPEVIKRSYDENPDSLNHHYFGDISYFFISRVAGIRVCSFKKINISPNFIGCLENANAEYQTPNGKVTSAWIREKDGITLTVNAPNSLDGEIILPEGYTFKNGGSKIPLESGEYKI